MDSDKWKAVDWMEWQAKGVAPRILMPAKSTRLKADQLLAVYGGADDASIAAYENVIDELAELFDVSRQAAKVRLMDLYTGPPVKTTSEKIIVNIGVLS